MFDFFKGGKVNLTVELDRPNPVYAPGETIHARVTIQNDKEIKIQNGRLTIVSEEQFQYKREVSSSSSSDNDNYTIETEWGSNDVEVFREHFFEEGTLPAGTHTYEIQCNLDPNAMPTCQGGNIIHSKWLVKATLDRKMAPDANEEVEFEMLSVMPPLLSTAGDYGISTDPNEVQMFLALSGKEFIHGTTVQGFLKVQPHKSFDASEVRIELERIEFVPNLTNSSSMFGSLENGSVTTVVKQKLAGKTHLEAGQTCQFPFHLDIPTNTPPTAQLNHGAIQYQLKGVLARTLRGDNRTELDVTVYSG